MICAYVEITTWISILVKSRFFLEAIFMSRWKEWKTAPVHVRDREEYFISPHCDWMHIFTSQRPEKLLSLPN